jgi:DNA-directed RNA polymerase II subunit RPB2
MAAMMPPPLRTDQGPVLDDAPPGEVRLDPSGRLVKQWTTYEGINKSIIDQMDVWYSTLIPRQIKARRIELKDGGYVAFTDVSVPRKPMLGVVSAQAEGARVVEEPLLPSQVRIDMRNYASFLYATAVHVDKDGREVERRATINLGSVPVMLGSSLCWLRGRTRKELLEMKESPDEPLGYFIYGGGERVLVTQENQRLDKILVNTKKFLQASITCSTALGTFMNTVYMHENTLRMGIRLFGMGPTKKPGERVVSLLPALKLLLEDYHQRFLEDDAFFDMLTTMVNTVCRKEWQKKVWISLQFSSFASKVTSLVDEVWAKWALPSTTVDGVFRPRKAKKAPEPAPEQLKRLTEPEKRALLIAELKKELFPHMAGLEPESTRLYNSIYLLVVMMTRFLEVHVGLRPPMDHEDLENKRTETAPRHCEKLLAGLWKKVIDTVQMNVDAATKTITLNDVVGYLMDSTKYISNEFRTSFTSSQWGVSGYKGETTRKENLSEPLNRLSMLSMIAHLKKVNVPTDRNTRNAKIRFVSNSQLGYLCPAETPEGTNCGLNKFFTVLSAVSVYREPALVLAALDAQGVALATARTDSQSTFFVLNGMFMGWCLGTEAHARLLAARRQGMLPYDICIVYDPEDSALHVYTDSARPVRPLLRVNPATQRLVIDELNLWRAPWDQLIRTGCVEYLDPWEANPARTFIAQFVADVRPPRVPDEPLTEGQLDQVARRKPYTHCEVDPTAILGYSVSVIPLPNHNQAPRNTFQASMGKQATTTSDLARHYPFSEQRVLAYPSRPLFQPQLNQMIGLDRAPPGVSCRVAILADAWNQEDSFVVNKSSVDRGLFWYTYYMPFKAVESETDRIECPLPSLQKNPSLYAALITDPKDSLRGTPRLGAVLGPGDVVLGRVRRLKTGDTETVTDESVVLGRYERGVVDAVWVGKTEDGKRYARVRVREVRRPIVGDKLASRSSQKGTISSIRGQESMPFFQDGTTPDIIINPHAIPSRMTMGKLIEFLAGKVGAATGKYINATAFRYCGDNFQAFYDDLRVQLEMNNYHYSGNDVLYNPVTGRKMTCTIYNGYVFYQLLKHTVLNKYQARSIGRRDQLTRAATSGRQLGGGIRFGEMERDAGASHGASAFLNDRLNKSSDAYKAVFCTTCGTETEVRKGLDGAVCRVCKTRGKYGVTEVPYAFRVLTGRLAMAGVRVNLLSLYSRADRFKRFDEEVEDPTETFNAANKKEGVPEEEEKAAAEPGEEEAEAEEEEEEEEVVEEEDVPMYDEEED